jgi:hypothetical protein
MTRQIKGKIVYMSAPATGIKPNGQTWTSRDVQVQDEDGVVWTMKVYKGAMDACQVDQDVELNIRITVDLINLVN